MEIPYDTASESSFTTSEVVPRSAESHWRGSDTTASSRPAESEYNASNPFTLPESEERITHASTSRASKIVARPTESVISRSTFPETDVSEPSHGGGLQASTRPVSAANLPRTIPGPEDTLAVLRARRARIAEERDNIERLQRLREEEETLEEEIARLERQREGG